MTRLYPITSGASGASLPAQDTGWASTATNFSTAAYLTRWRGTALGQSNFILRSFSETSATVHNIGLNKFVSEPLPAQTISGYVKMRFLLRQTNTAADMRAQVTIKVISGDGSMVRGTLLAMDDSATLDPEIPTSSLYMASIRFPRGWTEPGAALTPVVAQAGDRLLIETGVRALNTATTTYDINMGLSDGRSIQDIETTDVSTSPTINAVRMPLIEFSQDFWPAEPVFGEQPGAVWVRDAIHQEFYSGTSLAVTVPTVAAGDLVVATLRQSNARTVSVAGLGATWQTAQSSATDLGLHVFVGAGGSSGTVTLTLNSSDTAMFVSIYVVAGASGSYQVAHDGGASTLGRSVSLPVAAGGMTLAAAVGRDGIGDWGLGAVGPDPDDWLLMPSRMSGIVTGPLGVRCFAAADTATASYGTDGVTRSRRAFLLVFAPSAAAYRGWGVPL